MAKPIRQIQSFDLEPGRILVRNPGNRTCLRYAKELHKLRHCDILIQYLKKFPTVFRLREHLETMTW